MRTRVIDLADPDRALWPADELTAAVKNGGSVRRGSSEPAISGESWGSDRQIPGRMLREILLGAGDANARAAVIDGLRVTGELDLDGVELKVPLRATRCYFDKPVKLANAKAPELRLNRCHLPGLIAPQLTTASTVDLSGSTLGAVFLPGAKIGGNLILDRTTLGGPAGVIAPARRARGLDDADRPAPPPALVVDRAHVDHAMSCRRMQAYGPVTLICTHIEAQVSFEEADLYWGLVAYGCRLDQQVSCNGVHAMGVVKLGSARVGGRVEVESATLAEGFHAQDLHVGPGGLSFEDAWIGRPPTTGSDTPPAVDLASARIEGCLDLRFAAPPDGGVVLAAARVTEICDAERAWPATLNLDGCEYQSLDADDKDHGAQPWPRRVRNGLTALRRGLLAWEGPADVQQRLRWIRLTEADVPPDPARRRPRLQWLHARTFSPEPYTQLIALYRRAGHDKDARRAAHAREVRRWRAKRWTARPAGWLLRWVVGYGYRPFLALVWFAALVAVGRLVFEHSFDAGDLAAKTGAQEFRATLYTLDRLLPLVNLGIRDAFVPSGGAQWWAGGYTLVGWGLSITVLAGINAAVRRD